MDILGNIFKILGITTSATVVVYFVIKYFSKQIFENYLAKQLESHKSELERLNISHQVKFSTLHLERAEIIKKIYHHLYDYRLALLDFFQGELSEENPTKHFEHKLATWTKIVISLSEIFHKNKIFFSESQVKILNEIHNQMAKINYATNDYLESFEFLDQQVNSIQTHSPKFIDLKNNSLAIIDNIMKIEKELENEFRELLGV